MRLVFFFVFPLLLISCSTFDDILQSVNLTIDHNCLRLNYNYFNFLCFVREHGLSFPQLLEALDEKYYENSSIASETDRWIAIINSTVQFLVEEEPDTIEEIFNYYLILSHPFRHHFGRPFLIDDLKSDDYGAYFTKIELKIFNSLIQKIIYDPYFSSEIYSPSHIALLNLLYDFGSLKITETEEDKSIKYHLSFLFRASFMDFGLVLHNLFSLTFEGQPEFEVLAESIFESLYKKDKEKARLSLKFAVQVRTTDYSNLSYSDCIEKYTKNRLIPMLPYNLSSSLKSRNINSMKLSSQSQVKVVEDLKKCTKQGIFWLIYNEFYFEPFKFDSMDRDHFWWSLLYSLIHKYEQIQIFKRQQQQVIDYSFNTPQLLEDLKWPILEAANEIFLFSKVRESDLFRSILINGHQATIILLLDHLSGTCEISDIFPQKRIDFILRFVSFYASIETVNFLFSLSEFKFSLEAFEFFLLSCASHGKISLLLEFPSFLSDKILLKAASKGHFDIVKKIIGDFNLQLQFSKETIIKVLCDVFESNDLIILYEILNLIQMDLDLRSLPFLFKLFSKNDLNLCILVIDSTYFDDEEILEIVREASFSAFHLQQPQVLFSILEEGEIFFNQEAQSQILFNAITAKYPDFNLLRLIISNFGFTFTKEIRKHAISIALKQSSASDIVPILLEFPLIFASTESSMLLSLLTSLKVNNLFFDLITALKDRLSTFAYNSLLQEACKYHHSNTQVIESILKASGPSIYPIQTKNSLLFLAVQEGNFNFVKFIVNCGFKFSQKSLKKAALLAKKYRNIEAYLQRIINKN